MVPSQATCTVPPQSRIRSERWPLVIISLALRFQSHCRRRFCLPRGTVSTQLPCQQSQCRTNRGCRSGDAAAWDEMMSTLLANFLCLLVRIDPVFLEPVVLPDPFREADRRWSLRVFADTWANTILRNCRHQLIKGWMQREGIVSPTMRTLS